MSRFAVPADFSTNIEQVSVGAKRACAISTSKVLRCWGTDGMSSSIPNIMAVAVAPQSALMCVITTGFELQCFSNQQFGSADFTLADIAAMSLSDTVVCAVSRGGTLSCKQLSGKPFDTSVPNDFQSEIKAVSMGGSHMCAIKVNGALGCWGNNNTGQATVLTDFNTNIKAVSAGQDHTCAISQTGDLRCWGDDTYGQAAIPGGFDTNIVVVSASNDYTCAIFGTTPTGGSLRCWGLQGSDNFGQGTLYPC